MIFALSTLSNQGMALRCYPHGRGCVQGLSAKYLRRLGYGLVMLSALYAADRHLPKQFREYPGDEYHSGQIELPSDFDKKAEMVFARLMYPSIPDARFRHAGWDWTAGHASWTNDYPRADRHFVEALGRLTRLQVRSVEQPVSIDDPGELANYPWLYAVFVGEWDISDQEAHNIRDYLEKGGFLMCDDFWGSEDWTIFEKSIRKIFPDRAVVEIPNTDAIFHTVYDLDGRYQVPGEWGVRTGVPFRNDGYEARWRGVYDNKGRVMVAISFNSDLGDSWEWADDPEYPEQYSALGIRLGVNYIVYAMTH